MHKLLFAILLLTPAAQAQFRDTSNIPVNIRFAATRANAPPGACGCFFLVGAAADAAVGVLPGVSLAVEVAGDTVDRVAGTTRGLSTITLLAGPRYTVPIRRLAVSGQTLFGAVRGFDADFSAGITRADTATAFGMALGGFAEIPLTSVFNLRVMQIDYVQTNLPNDANNRQRNIRLGMGITFHVPMPRSRR